MWQRLLPIMHYRNHRIICQHQYRDPGMGADVLSGVDGAVSFSIGGVVISLSGLAVASIAGIILNAVFPDKDEVNDVTESK